MSQQPTPETVANTATLLKRFCDDASKQFGDTIANVNDGTTTPYAGAEAVRRTIGWLTEALQIPSICGDVVVDQQVSDRENMEAFEMLGIDPAMYLNTHLRSAGYTVCKRTTDYIDVMRNGEIRRKHINHPQHGENVLKKLLKDETYFRTWKLVGDE